MHVFGVCWVGERRACVEAVTEVVVECVRVRMQA